MVRMTKEYYLDSTSWNFKEGRTRMYIKGWVADVFVLMVINISLAGGLKMHTFSSYSLKNYVIVFKIRWPDNINHILKIKSDIKKRFRNKIWHSEKCWTLSRLVVFKFIKTIEPNSGHYRHIFYRYEHALCENWPFYSKGKESANDLECCATKYSLMSFRILCLQSFM